MHTLNVEIQPGKRKRCLFSMVSQLRPNSSTLNCLLEWAGEGIVKESSTDGEPGVFSTYMYCSSCALYRYICENGYRNMHTSAVQLEHGWCKDPKQITLWAQDRSALALQEWMQTCLGPATSLLVHIWTPDFQVNWWLPFFFPPFFEQFGSTHFPAQSSFTRQPWAVKAIRKTNTKWKLPSHSKLLAVLQKGASQRPYGLSFLGWHYRFLDLLAAREKQWLDAA